MKESHLLDEMTTTDEVVVEVIRNVEDDSVVVAEAEIRTEDADRTLEAAVRILEDEDVVRPKHLTIGRRRFAATTVTVLVTLHATAGASRFVVMPTQP